MPPIKQLLFESMRSGTIAAIAMMPFGFAFRALGLRVGHYGPKFAALFVNDPGPAFQFAQHIVLGWLSAAPLVLLLCWRRVTLPPVVAGSVYGVAYYVAVNSLALPLYFGDELPWQKGIATVIPSLVIHLVFGACVGYFSRHLLPNAHTVA
jgi:hypothetical protein